MYLNFNGACYHLIKDDETNLLRKQRKEKYHNTMNINNN